MYTRTSGTTLFRLDLHQGDVGHTMVVGPTGSGKSVLLNFLALQWLRYPTAQVFIFDKGRSTRATTLLVGGDFFHLRSGHADLSLQPLARIDEPVEAAWAYEWLEDLLTLAGQPLTASNRQELWDALLSVASAPPDQRSLTLLEAAVQDADIRAVLRRFTADGPLGGLLDGVENRLGQARWQAFEVGDLLHSRAAAPLVLTHLFRKLEDRFDGSPTLLIIDEAWMLLENSLFSAKLREWLKTLRKRNVAVVFATQSLADITESAIAATIAESCPTRIFLGNPQAATETASGLYRALGLSEQQIKLISCAVPKRQYYYTSPAGSRLFELALGPLALLAAARTSGLDQELVDRALGRGSRDEFPEAFFKLASPDHPPPPPDGRLERPMSAIARVGS
jgi:type IV secretion system protein VirB4